ncbi:MAG: F0F1 ATP synthase subunit A [Candidatus Latescibacteria bacterium]|jgi:F-type H+-transporting ATPase subunit a|nr:F0F1 ATP synthase subunit A [Candidatus Latescibacterota bacterium]MBT4139762.1 F0F1 ATP synthase subunit A [Candidatus Latescibacterota bacterium]MBT5832588.1 F0F1 ATP synthase subunit A [Candidatus Latescibacterota bacterium]
MAAAAEGNNEGGGVDILSHILDSHELHLGPLHIPLPHLELFGIDMSITVHLVMMWIASLFLLLTLISTTKKRGLVPSGFANAIEALIIFIRDDIVIPNIGKKDTPRFLPFLLTAFIFILACNLLGLIPFGATATANINVTATLAICSFMAMLVGGIRHNGFIGYFVGLIPSGLPLWLMPLMIPLEFLGLFTKPFALAVRLFANMTAGHVVIISLLSLIFVLNTVVVAPASVIFALAIYLLEIFVSFVQAYVFTLLSAVFIGMAIHQEH